MVRIRKKIDAVPRVEGLQNSRMMYKLTGPDVRGVAGT